MTSQLVVDVVRHLCEAAYVERSLPLAVAGVPFSFPAILTAPRGSLNLVVVADLRAESQERTAQKMEALGQALDVTGSRRSLTTIICNAPADFGQSHELNRRLSAVGRVLSIREGLSPTSLEESLNNDLAILIPLTMPASISSSAKPVERVLQHLSTADRNSLAPSGIVNAASRGEAEVRRELIAWIGNALLEEEPS